MISAADYEKFREVVDRLEAGELPESLNVSLMRPHIHTKILDLLHSSGARSLVFQGLKYVLERGKLYNVQEITAHFRLPVATEE